MRRLIYVLLLGLSACGYAVGTSARGPRLLAIEAIEEDGIDVDAAALVHQALARAVSAGPSTALASPESSEARLAVRLVDSGVQLVAYNDPSARALQYRATIRIAAVLTQTDGTRLWASPVIMGQAPYVSPPGQLSTLDGARRRALARAADDAAAQLIAWMVHGRA